MRLISLNLGDEKIVEFLIKNGANVNLVNKKGETPLLRFAALGNYP